MTDHSERDEEWRKIPFDSRYSASSRGRIRNDMTGHILKPNLRKNGYYQVRIGNKTLKVHRIVGLAFKIIDQQDHINHIDGKKTNNDISNLERSNNAHNNRHAIRNGLRRILRGEENVKAKLTESEVREIVKLRRKGYELEVLGQIFDVNMRTISAICTGKNWKHLKLTEWSKP